jgi:hypothetical protein
MQLARQLKLGLAAGAAGTAAMTVSSTIEMKLRGREPSMVPEQAAEKALGVHPSSEEGRKRLGTAAHVATGMSLGMLRAAIGAAGVREPAASAIHFPLAWSPDLVGISLMGLAEPPWKWGAKEVLISGFHHAVYTAGASLTYDRLA